MTQASATMTMPSAQRPRRPLSISIIAVLSMIYGVASLIPKVFLLASPEAYEQSAGLLEAMTGRGAIAVSMEGQMAVALFGSLVCVTAGVFMWRGRNWARWLAVAWIGWSLLWYLLLAGSVMSFYIKIPVAVLLVFFLTTRKSSAYFRVPA